MTKSSTFHKMSCSECAYSSQCKNGQCAISLSYVEGSSWTAYEVMRTPRCLGAAVELALPHKGCYLVKRERLTSACHPSLTG